MPYFHHFLFESLVNNKCNANVAANQQRPNNNSKSASANLCVVLSFPSIFDAIFAIPNVYSNFPP